ncbi:MAG: serine/threonine protein kinase, partial [Planctomycetaceae bacterium]|nr:serine/threonine protein kinase [Planctomycetaceae bacterium]
LHQPDAIQRFRNEARSAARLDHENIARVFYFAEEKGVHFIVGEFVTGMNIRELIHSEGRLKPTDAVYYTHQIASALNHTSAAGVIHRDIKPSNIIVTQNGLAKLVDLGLARKESTDSTDDLTIAGTTLGTFDYLAPEQARDPRCVDVRSDIYSLGCTLYHMLTGEPPYPGGTVAQKLHNHQAAEIPDPADKVPNLPPLLSHTVKKMMASDPVDRYRTPDELLNDLEEVAHQLGMPGAHGRVIRRPASISPKRARWERSLIWVAMGLLLISVVMILDALTQSPLTIPGNGEQGNSSPPSSPSTSNNSTSLPTETTSANQLDQPMVAQDQEKNSTGLVPSPERENSQNNRDGNPNKTNLNPTSPGISTQENDLTQAFVVKNTEGGEELSYASLAQACEAASQNAVIEIQSSSTEPLVIDQPFQLIKKSIRLRPVAGTRPRLQFQYSAERPSRYQGMIDLRGGCSLSLFNLDLEFQIDPLSKELSPTLFALIDNGNSLNLNGCQLTVANNKSKAPMVIRVAKGTSFDETLPPSNPMLPDEKVKIEIVKSYFHGNSRCFQIDTAVPTTLSVSESIIASGGDVFYLNQSTTGNTLPIDPLTQPKPPHTIEFNLARSTVLCGKTFLYLDQTLNNSETMPFVEINSSDNVFVSNPVGQTFVQTNFTASQQFFSPANLSPDRMKWKDNQGSDYLSNFRIYYANDNGEPEPLPPVTEIDLWRRMWKNASNLELTSKEVSMVLRGVNNSHSLASLTLNNFILQGSEGENSPIGGSS